MSLRSNILQLLVITFALFVFTGCFSTQVSDVKRKALKLGSNKDQETAGASEETNTPPLPSAQALQIPIGTVHMVDQVGKFILIKSSRTSSLEPDAQIVSYGANAQISSQLRASPARKGAYLTADLIDGIPKVGDMVMVVKSITNYRNKSGVQGMPSRTNVQVLE